MSKRLYPEHRIPKREYDALVVAECARLRSLEISLPAQKPASVPGGSGAGLVGNPLTLSGDAWEAAANFVISARCVA